MNKYHGYRLFWVVALLAGSALIVTLILYALRSNIDLFYTPGEVLQGKGEALVKPEIGQRLRIGGMVQPGSLVRDDQTLKVTFVLYDALGEVTLSYEGILPDLFREGQSIVAQGILVDRDQIQATEVLAKHDENYMPTEVAEAMDEQHSPATKAQIQATRESAQ